MKLDVSYTDHSHIIGKGGLTIKKVMEETSCHIHFPDSNRSNHQEKSNQVSIAGDMEGVEKARARVRVSSCHCSTGSSNTTKHIRIAQFNRLQAHRVNL